MPPHLPTCLGVELHSWLHQTHVSCLLTLLWPLWPSWRAVNPPSVACSGLFPFLFPEKCDSCPHFVFFFAQMSHFPWSLTDSLLKTAPTCHTTFYITTCLVFLHSFIIIWHLTFFFSHCFLILFRLLPLIRI